MKGFTRHNPCLLIILSLALLAASHRLCAQGTAFEAGKQAYLDKDYPKALELLRPLAESGHGAAQVSLGIIYDLGQGVEKNPAKATQWLEKAALQNNAFVQHDLGVRYFKGDNIPKNYRKAVKWWQMAAENGLAESQYNMGLLYARGLGLERDPAQAAQWYEKAASQGHAHAQYNLAVLYINGHGVRTDKTRALELFRQSAESGIPQAQYNLAALLEGSDALTDDFHEARHWYQAAADQGINQAENRLAALPPPGKGLPIPTIAAKTTAIEKTNDKAIINREFWIRRQPSAHYTIQLVGVSRETAIRQFFKKHQLGDNAAYFRATLNGKPFYKVIQGVYPDRKSAIGARTKLSEKLRKAGPMIVRLGDIQRILSPETATLTGVSKDSGPAGKVQPEPL